MPLRASAPAGAPTWIELLTSDPEASRRFYSQLFGWESEVLGAEYGDYVTFSTSGVSVAGGVPSRSDDGTSDRWSVYLATDDVERVAEAAEDNGGRVLSPPARVMTLGSMVVLADAGGATVSAWQAAEHKGFGILAEPGSPAWFELLTRDYAASLRFYEQVFGWRMTVVGDTDEFRYSTFGGEGEQVAGVMDASSSLAVGEPARWSVYFAVADTDAALTHVGTLGGSVLTAAEDTPFGRMAEVADPTGARLKLVAAG